jgi:hypothetical protein
MSAAARPLAEPAPAARSVGTLTLLAVTLIAARLALMGLVHPAYGFHRDELLYFAMGEHLDPFRMQFPPLIAVLARVSRGLFGPRVLAARVPAALAGTALFATVLFLARRFGGHAWATILAGLAMVAAPVFLRASLLFQPVGLDQLWCAVAVGSLCLVSLGASPRWWLGVGLGLGLGALTKFSVAFYGVGILAATVLTPLRRRLATPWPWLAALLAVLLALPSVTGQLAHGWPFLAQARALTAGQLDRVTAGDFFAGQPRMLGAGVLVAGAGLVAAAAGPDRRRLGPAALFALAVLAILLLLRGKPYYAAPIYPVLVAIGAVAFERWLARGRRRMLRPVLAVLLVAGAVPLLPMGIPVLGPDAMARYAARLGLTAPVRTNRGVALRLPQDYADMLGWEPLVGTVATAAGRVPPSERGRLVVLAGNYGEAGALDLFGPARGLPRPVSPAGDFHAWGPGPLPGDLVLVVGVSRPLLTRYFGAVDEVARFDDPWMVPEERDLRIYLCRQPVRTLQAVWPEIGPQWD